jgi:predicted dehydrogenase
LVLPDFFQKGGGPILDLAPYYISNLVQTLGPVKKFPALQQRQWLTTRRDRPRRNAYNRPCTISFKNGAIITLLASWDVWSNNHPIMKEY